METDTNSDIAGKLFVLDRVMRAKCVGGRYYFVYTAEPPIHKPIGLIKLNQCLIIKMFYYFRFLI